MARTNKPIAYPPELTHEGAVASRIPAYKELRRSVLTCMLHEPTFYEKGSEITARIAALVKEVPPVIVASLAIEARDRMLLRHVPLFLVRELARQKGNGPLVETALANVIQRADELSEFLAMYWAEGKKPLSAGVKRGLATAFQKFNAYHLAKYNRDDAVKLRDVLFLVHPKPQNGEQAETWRKLASKTLESPDTWEVELSAGKDKKETFERLMREGKLGGLAALRNLRGMLQAGVDEMLIRERLSQGIHKALPFRFVVAAKHAPTLEDAIEEAMFQGTADLPPFPGRTGLLIDVSRSMDYTLGLHKGESSQFLWAGLLAKPDETCRIDVAAALAILLREKCPAGHVATFSNEVVDVPPRRGFALRDAINNSQAHSGTKLASAINTLSKRWIGLERLIVITDEQSQDGIGVPFASKNWLINVAPYKNGVSYVSGWNRIDGWSDRVLDYIAEAETESLEE